MKEIKGPVNWGIIGCGDVCEVKSGPVFGSTPDSNLVAVMRRNRAAAADFARRHHVPNYFDDASAITGSADINAVYIATPPSTHELYAERSMREGKAVYVEKPVCTNAEGCRRLIAVAEETGVPVAVAHYRRELPMFRKIKELIAAGTIGKVRTIRCATFQPLSDEKLQNWRVDPAVSGGGLFHDLAPHQLDIFGWIFGFPDDVQGFAANQTRRSDADDLVLMNAQFPTGIAFTGIWCFGVPWHEEQTEIAGETGKLSFSFFGSPELTVTTKDGTSRMKFENPKHIQQPMIEAVVRFFRGQGSSPCSLHDALSVMEIIDKVTQRPG